MRTPRSYRGRDGRYQAPKETTFQRVLARVDRFGFEKTFLTREARVLGGMEESPDTLIAIDGNARRGSTPEVTDEQIKTTGHTSN